MRDAFFTVVISLALVIPSRCYGPQSQQSSQTDTNLINYSAGVKDYGVITGEAAPSEPLAVATSSETPAESPRYWWQNVDSPFIKDAQPSVISVSSTLPPVSAVELNIVSDAGTTGLRIPSPDHRLTQALYPNNPFLNGEIEQRNREYTIAPTVFTTSATTPGGPRDYPQGGVAPVSSNSIAPSGYPSGIPQTGDHTNGYSPSTEQAFPTAAPTPYPGCAAALKCVPETYCNQQGFASDTPVELTKEFLYNRVPLTDCLDEPTGIIGKCCRDPNYKDPWPADLPHEHGHEHGHEHSHEHEHEHEHTDSNSVHPDESVKPATGIHVIPISAYQPPAETPNSDGDYGGVPAGGYKPPPPPPPPSPSPPYGQPQPPTSPPHQPHPSHPSHPTFIPPYKPSFPPHSSSYRPPPQHPFHPPFTPGGGSQPHPGPGSQITYPGSGSQPHPGPGSQITYPGSGSQPHPGPGSQITYPGSGSQPHPGPGSQITYPGSGSQPHPGSGSQITYPGSGSQPHPGPGYPGSHPGPSPTFPPQPPSQPPPYGSNKPPPLSIIPPQQPSQPTVPVSPPPSVYPGSPPHEKPGESSPSYPVSPPTFVPSKPGYPSYSPPEYPSKPPYPEQPPTHYPQQPPPPQHPQEPPHYPQQPSPQYPSQPPPQYPSQPPTQYPQRPPPQRPQHPPPHHPQRPPPQYPQQPPPQYPQQPPPQYPSQPPPQYPSQPPTQYPQHPPPQYPSQPPPQYPSQPPTQYPQRPPPQYPSQPPPQYPSQPPTQYPQQPQPQYPSQPPTQYPEQPPQPPAQYPYPQQPSNPDVGPYAEKHSAGPEVVEVTQPPYKYHILNKFEGSCGTKKNDGTAHGNAPWHVIVYSSKNKDLICAGAIVSDNAILTAAHCLDHSEADSTEVKIGPQGKMYKVAAIARHSQYEPISFNRDLALVFLHEPILSDEYVEKICLPTSVSPGQAKDCYASSMDKDFEQSTLEVVPVEVFPYKDCEIKLRNTYLGKYFILNDSFSCVSTPAEKELCTVKTGSPIACSRGDGSYELFGIKSWDLGCQQYKSSAIFSNADVEWIQNTLQTPLSVLSDKEKARRKDKFKGESLAGVNINEKPGFGQGYGK